MKYFVISNSDGDTTVSVLTKSELLEQLNPSDEGTYYGQSGYLDEEGVAAALDSNYWGDNILIIKGDIVIPKPKEVIRVLEVD